MSFSDNPALYFGIGVICIGSITLAFSFSKEKFINFFVPDEEKDEANKAIPDEKNFSRGMRLMALLQIGIGMVFLVFGIFRYFESGV